MMSITVRFTWLLLQVRIARRTSAAVPKRHLMRRSDLVALGIEADMARTPEIGRS